MKTLTHMDVGHGLHASEGGLGPAMAALSIAAANVFHELGMLLRHGPVREYRSANDRSMNIDGTGYGESSTGRDQPAKQPRVFFDDTADFEQA